MVDYTCPIYLVLNTMAKTNGKFGLGMNLNVLGGKKSKVKEWMESWDEYGSGISFGNDDWWKELVRYLLNNDYVIETQAQGMFFSTISLTDKGKELRNKLLSNYPNYLALLKDSTNSNSKTYKSFQIKLPKIESTNSSKSVKSSKSTKSTKSAKSTKSTKSDKTTISDKTIKSEKRENVKINKSNVVNETKISSDNNKIKNLDIHKIGAGSLRNKLSHILNSDSDSD